ncbi:hypothetical protein P4H66_25965 [Paenibacillus dokdonensis]|uniref:Uncharacterized protein n=1 Tax=Paenibacillus dokdonensis TaxID=2567944 RepID=A0ABU6GX36_9BACL|nr:hypothetical protein [Paenibacillus dokdonensis]MEC0243265.1 hypothetical protein [Paenibacillus dokdonensis]
MNQEDIQKAYEGVRRIMKPIVETITRLWNAFKTWVIMHLAFARLLGREMAREDYYPSLFRT